MLTNMKQLKSNRDLLLQIRLINQHFITSHNIYFHSIPLIESRLTANWLIVAFAAKLTFDFSLRFDRNCLQIFECLLFETDDLIMRKNEKHVILCLLEVARRGAKFGKQNAFPPSLAIGKDAQGANWNIFFLSFLLSQRHAGADACADGATNWSGNCCWQ